MKKSFVFVAALAMLPVMAAAAPLFPDAKENHWAIDALRKLCHRKSIFTLDQVLNIIKISCNGPSQLPYLLFFEIIFGNCYIRLQDASFRCVFPSG